MVRSLRLGYNVLLLDSDTVLINDPYVHFKRLSSFHLIAQVRELWCRAVRACVSCAGLCAWCAVIPHACRPQANTGLRCTLSSPHLLPPPLWQPQADVLPHTSRLLPTPPPLIPWQPQADALPHTSRLLPSPPTTPHDSPKRMARWAWAPRMPRTAGQTALWRGCSARWLTERYALGRMVAPSSRKAGGGCRDKRVQGSGWWLLLRVRLEGGAGSRVQCYRSWHVEAG